jgi:Chitin binding Peritrophin-A domain
VITCIVIGLLYSNNIFHFLFFKNVESFVFICRFHKLAPHQTACDEPSKSLNDYTHFWNFKDFLNFQDFFTCPVPDGAFPDPNETCSDHFYLCVSGIPFLSVSRAASKCLKELDLMYFPQTCPGGTVFDPVQSSCLVFEDSTCFGRKFNYSLYMNEVAIITVCLFTVTTQPTDIGTEETSEWTTM